MDGCASGAPCLTQRPLKGQREYWVERVGDTPGTPYQQRHTISISKTSKSRLPQEWISFPSPRYKSRLPSFDSQHPPKENGIVGVPALSVPPQPAKFHQHFRSVRCVAVSEEDGAIGPVFEPRFPIWLLLAVLDPFRSSRNLREEFAMQSEA